MAIPKRRKSSSARDRRRSHHRVDEVTLINSGTGARVPHALKKGIEALEKAKEEK